MLVRHLIDAIASEKSRVWGEEGFRGEPKQYRWLLEWYGITEEEEALWSAILLHEFSGVTEEDCDEKTKAFLNNRNELAQFLYGLLRKYRISHEVYRP